MISEVMPKGDSLLFIVKLCDSARHLLDLGHVKLSTVHHKFQWAKFMKPYIKGTVIIVKPTLFFIL